MKVKVLNILQLSLFFRLTEESMVIYVHNHDMFLLTELEHYGTTGIVLTTEEVKEHTKYFEGIYQLGRVQKHKKAIKSKHCVEKAVNLSKYYIPTNSLIQVSMC